MTKQLRTLDLYQTFPWTAVLVTCVDPERGPNILTIAWTGVLCAQPPTVYIAVRRGKYSLRALRETNEFVVNVPNEDLLSKTDYCGDVSGSKFNKWEEAGLTPEPATKLSTPMIAECPINLECKVTNVMSIGSHEVFFGEVVAIHADDSILDEAGKLQVNALRPLIYHCHAYWGLRDGTLGRRGLGVKMKAGAK